MQSLVDFFNSSVGELSSYKSDLELITIMINQTFKPIAKKHIIYNLKHIEKQISPHFKDLVKSILKEKTEAKIKTHTEQVEEILNNQIQKKTKEFIANNKKIYSYIKV
jgi:spore coat protein CotF